MRIHVVSLTDGTDRVIASATPWWDVLAYEPEGLYVTSVRWGGEGATGLWLVDPATGTSTQLPNGGPFSAIDSGVAWTDGWGIMPTQLEKVNVSTGTSQTWIDTQGEGWLWFVGLDSNGDPLVDVSQGTNTNWRLFVYTAPQTRTLLAAISIYHIGLTDSHGTWLAAEDGIYLLGPGLQLVKVSDVTGGNVAGACN
jgi:hypothetical protein